MRRMSHVANKLLNSGIFGESVGTMHENFFDAFLLFLVHLWSPPQLLQIQHECNSY